MFHGFEWFVEDREAVPTTIRVESTSCYGVVEVSKVGNRVTVCQANLPLGHFFFTTYVVDRPVRRPSQVCHRRSHDPVTFLHGCYRYRTYTTPTVTSVNTTVTTCPGLDDPHFVFLLVHENFIDLPQLFVNPARPVMLMVMSHFTKFHKLHNPKCDESPCQTPRKITPNKDLKSLPSFGRTASSSSSSPAREKCHYKITPEKHKRK